MNIPLLLRLLVCVFILGLSMYVYIARQNEITELRIALPDLTDEIRISEEKNLRLQYEIDRFESPLRLLELSRKPEFRHLKHPYTEDTIEMPAGEPIKP